MRGLPTRRQASGWQRAARDLLLDVIRDFSFVDQASAANTLPFSRLTPAAAGAYLAAGASTLSWVAAPKKGDAAGGRTDP